MDTAKICTSCQKLKKLDQFSPKANGKFGRQAQCKACRSVAQAAVRAADPDKARAANRKADRKRGPSTARVQKWRQDHPEEARRRSRQDRAKRRARLAGAAIGNVCFESLYAAFPDCYLCGLPLADEVDVDHVIPLSQGGAHSQANLRPTHEACNLRKADKLLADLDWYAGPVDIGQQTCDAGATTTNEGDGS